MDSQNIWQNNRIYDKYKMREQEDATDKFQQYRNVTMTFKVTVLYFLREEGKLITFLVDYFYGLPFKIVLI